MSDNLECSAAPRTVTVELGTPILELARRIQPLRDHRVTIDQNFVFCEELPEKGFASLINRPRLVVVLVLERPSHVWRTLAHPVLLRIKALDQFREHGHNTYQHFFAGLNSFRKSKSFVRHQFSRRSEHKDDDEYEDDTLVVTPPRCVLCAIQGAGPGGYRLSILGDVRWSTDLQLSLQDADFGIQRFNLLSGLLGSDEVRDM
jgi:hypothetical protein